MNTVSTRRFLIGAGAGLAALSSLITPAFAALNVEQKIGEVGSPVEWRRPVCVMWAKFHAPDLVKLRMKKRHECVGHKYQNLQHSFFLVAKGPDADQAVKRALDEAISVAVSAAIGAGILMPGDPTVRIAAGVVAGKKAFVGYLAARGLGRLVAQYDLRIEHRTHW